MDQTKTARTPAWAAEFLAALRTGIGARAASRAAGIGTSTPYALRKRDAAFAAEWEAWETHGSRRSTGRGPRPAHYAAKYDRFLAELAESSNVAAAAEVAGVTPSQVYKLRRTDPAFAAKWYAALAEGYDNLEMELLQHLRGGESEDSADKPKRKFDTAAALRSLAAHREAVTREKGRRTLAEEAATIAAINARIDAMRAKAEASAGAIRAAGKRPAKRGKPDA